MTTATPVCPEIVPVIIFSEDQITGNSTDRFQGAVVEIYCQSGFRPPSGSTSQIVVCKINGWDPTPITSCQAVPEGLSQTDIIAIACSVAGFLLITVLLVVGCVCYRRRKDRKDYHDDKRSWSSQSYDTSRSGSNHQPYPTKPYLFPVTLYPPGYPVSSDNDKKAIPRFEPRNSLRYNSKQSWNVGNGYDKNAQGMIPRPHVRPFPFFYGYINPYGYPDVNYDFHSNQPEASAYLRNSSDKRSYPSAQKSQLPEQNSYHHNPYDWSNQSTQTRDKFSNARNNNVLVTKTTRHQHKDKYGYVIRKI